MNRSSLLPALPLVACGVLTLGLVSALPVSLEAQAKPAATPEAPAPKFETADKLWAHLDELKSALDKREQTSAEAMLKDVRGLASGCEEFVQRFPQDPRRHEARLLRLQLVTALAETDPGIVVPPEAEILGTLREVADAPDAPPPIQADARFSLLNVDAAMLEQHVPDAPKPEDVAAKAADFEKRFPTDDRTDAVRLIRAKIIEKQDPAAALAIFKGLAGSKDPEAAAEANGQVAVSEVREKGLELKFTAVDGREFDLAKLRGKVVLVDFWATWCVPCVQKLPEIKAAYDKLHDKGFEIVGISLDTDKEALTKFTAGKNLPWPQYFDGKQWENAISSRYGIRAIPRAWLVDKAGKVTDFEVRDGLEAAVEKLLAAP